VLLRELLAMDDLEIHLIVTSSAVTVMREEMGLEFPGHRFDAVTWLNWTWPSGLTSSVPPVDPEVVARRVVLHRDGDVAAGPASGSFRHQGMIICPCSMRTLATIASGTGACLLTRAADATLKERRRLVLVPRETPLNLIHLRNMVTVTEAGATVLPAMPGFYHRPQAIHDILRFVVMKVIDASGLHSDRMDTMRWKE
jgi:polyprenyl P-hydroxybenzoate/phenylacrylic acid decarboxylase-like protein